MTIIWYDDYLEITLTNSTTIYMQRFCMSHKYKIQQSFRILSYIYFFEVNCEEIRIGYLHPDLLFKF
jgi:hypothetical protein